MELEKKNMQECIWKLYAIYKGAAIKDIEKTRFGCNDLTFAKLEALTDIVKDLESHDYNLDSFFNAAVNPNHYELNVAPSFTSGKQSAIETEALKEKAMVSADQIFEESKPNWV